MPTAAPFHNSGRKKNLLFQFVRDRMSTTVTAPFVNIAAYKFVGLENLRERREELRERCLLLGLKGTILLSREGINLFLAGSPESITTFLGHLRSHAEFQDLEVKESPSDHQPFSRMLVRIKKEIITLGVEGIDPVNKPSPKLPPETLRQWIRERRPIHLLDTRNIYEVELGTFENAVTLPIDSFRQFPEAIRQLPESWKKEPVVMFCTGGIRCEKAGPLMEREGYEQIFQLEGGILKYFEECHGEGYTGDCFVFDKRVTVNPGLQETEAGLCFACQAVLSAADQQHPNFQPPRCCPHCFQAEEVKMRARIEQRNVEIRRRTSPLPGSTPYDNIRPLNVPEKYDLARLIDVLQGMHGHVPPDYWQNECRLGRIRCQDQLLNEDAIVRAGARLEHLFPQTVEPEVNAAIEILYEDDALVAVNKPAPLPMHPCGRFNRNSLIYILDQIYAPHCLRMLHRLDANTTGVVVLARTKEHSRRVHPQFANGQVQKKYLALVHGVPLTESFHCDLKISREATRLGGRFADTEGGLPCTTEFQLLKTNGQHSLLECRPLTGRTNQIRLHLASLGLPIVGDPLYRRPEACLENVKVDDGDELTHTLSVNAPPLCLHSWELTFENPLNGKRFKVSAPPPSWSIL